MLKTQMDHIPHIYCINLDVSKDRKSRMQYRFKYYKLDDRVHYVSGIPWDSPIIKYYHQGFLKPNIDIKKWNRGT